MIIYLADPSDPAAAESIKDATHNGGPNMYYLAEQHLATTPLLLKRYQIQSTPALCLLDADCSLITRSGRQHLRDDPECTQFPWRPSTFTDLINAGPLIDSMGQEYDPACLAGKSVALLFGRHTCMPCRAFSVEVRRILMAFAAAERNDVEFLLCSEDTTEADYWSFLEGKSCLFVPYDPERRLAFAKLFPHSGTPSLVTVGPDGTVLCENAKRGMLADTTGAGFPWRTAQIDDLSVTTNSKGVSLNEQLSAVLLFEYTASDQQTELVHAFNTAAEAVQHTEIGIPKLLFFTALRTCKAANQIRRMCHIQKRNPAPALVILDIAGDYVYWACSPEQLTPQGVLDFCMDAQNDNRAAGKPIQIY